MCHGMPAGHQCIGCLVVKHRHQFGAPDREVIKESRHPAILRLLHVAVAIQIILTDVTLHTETAELFL